MSLGYLLVLLGALGGLVLIDHRARLVFWRDARRAGVTLVAGVAMLLVADAVGIALGIFTRGAGGIATGVLLAPELPLEEPVFLVFLCYLTLMLTGIGARVLPRRPRATGEGGQ